MTKAAAAINASTAAVHAAARLGRWFILSAVLDAFVVRRAERLLADGRTADADRALSRRVTRRPHNRALRLHHAFLAHHAGLHDEAARRWDALRADWPDTAIAWCGSASNRRETGQLHAARGIIAEARTRFPDDLVTITEAIRIHERFGDRHEVLRLSAAMIRLDPGCAEWRHRHFDRLMAAGRIDDAAALLETGTGAWQLRGALLALRRGDAIRARSLLEAMERTDASATASIAEAAEGLRLRHPAESLVLFGRLDAIEPDRADHLHGIVGCHIRLGAFGTASSVLAGALERHPTDLPLLKDKAAIAIKTEGFAEALVDLRRLSRDWPNDAELAEMTAHATQGAAHLRAERSMDTRRPGGTPLLREDVGHVDDEEARQMLLGFESLGQDCEFGLLQRRFGAEPLGLFRWNFCETARLAEALRDGLEGVGEAAHSALLLWDDHEYYLKDLRYGFTMHSWQSKTEIAREVLLPKMCTRVAILRRKLLEDLRSGHKIFVHKSFATTVDDVMALSDALRDYGANTLLWVRSVEHPAEHTAPRPGVVEAIAPGLLSARLTRFGNRMGAPWQIPYGEWLALCAQAVAHVGPSVAVSG